MRVSFKLGKTEPQYWDTSQPHYYYDFRRNPRSRYILHVEPHDDFCYLSIFHFSDPDISIDKPTPATANNKLHSKPQTPQSQVHGYGKFTRNPIKGVRGLILGIEVHTQTVSYITLHYSIFTFSFSTSSCMRGVRF